jgi:hypothetical protein
MGPISDFDTKKNKKCEEDVCKQEDDFIDYKVKEKKNYFENRIKNIDNGKNSNLGKSKQLSKSCNFNEEIFKINPNIKASVNYLPKPEYVVIDDIELSDTSYDDDADDDEESADNTIDVSIGDTLNNVKKEITVKNVESQDLKPEILSTPPPKPKRTFEHEIYMTFKLDLNKAFSTNLPDYNDLNIDSPKNKNSIGSNKTDHIYESLGSVPNFMNSTLNDNVFKKENKIKEEELPKLSRSSNQLKIKKIFNTKLKVLIFF